jgi:HTH-type transcriptional regulator / antitoxin HigA
MEARMEARKGERKPAEVFHPGEHLLDELNARGWTQTEFADIIGRPIRLVNEVVNGKRGITPETAREFGAAFGTSAEFWMNLDNAYQLWKTKEDVSQIEHRAKMRCKYPIRDLILRGWIRSSEDTRVVESQLLRFFEISFLDEQPKLAWGVATKRSTPQNEELTAIQIAWLYRVKHIAETIQATEYSKKNLENAIISLMNFREAPEEIRHIPQLLVKCGVRFVIVEPLPSSKIDGATFWLGAHSPVIGLSLRYDRIDNFWFVLRHEIEHVLNGDGKDAAILDSDLDSNSRQIGSFSKEENVANEAAAEFCTPQKDLNSFIDRISPLFSRTKVVAFAKNHNIHPGLVVGQLQKHQQRYDLFRSLLVPVRDIITPVAMTDGYGHILPVKV